MEGRLKRLRKALHRTTNMRNMSKVCFGIDGCKNGWVAARLEDNHLYIEFYENILKFVQANPNADEYLIDMAIGFPSCKEQVRPDKAARKILGKKGVTVFPVPCRQVVEIGTSKESVIQNREELKELNRKKLGVSLTQQTLAIIPKMAELDRFLQEHPEYRDRICESHPEVCFARLNGNKAIEIKKSRSKGVSKRTEVLEKYLEPGALSDIKALAKKGNCKPDDVLDAVCLAVTAKFNGEGKCECIHGDVKPEEYGRLVDNKGLRMQMVVPAVDVSKNTK